MKSILSKAIAIQAYGSSRTSWKRKVLSSLMLSQNNCLSPSFHSVKTTANTSFLAFLLFACFIREQNQLYHFCEPENVNETQDTQHSITFVCDEDKEVKRLPHLEKTVGNNQTKNLGGIAKEPNLCIAMPNASPETFALKLERPEMYVIEREMRPDGMGWRLVCFDKGTKVLINIMMEDCSGLKKNSSIGQSKERKLLSLEQKKEIPFEASTCFKEPQIKAYTKSTSGLLPGPESSNDTATIAKEDFHVTVTAREGHVNLIIRLSKPSFEPSSDLNCMKDILSSFQVHSSYQLTPKEHFALGTLLFHNSKEDPGHSVDLQQNQDRPIYDDTKEDAEMRVSPHEVDPKFSRSLRHFEYALADFDKVGPEHTSLTSKELQSAINHCGVLLVLHGRQQEALELFQRGGSVFPAYPHFEYNLACIYAELQDETSMFVHLKKALTLAAKNAHYNNREQYISSRLTNPSKDLSFAAYWDNRQFCKLIDDYYYINGVCNDSDVI
mmetsp:Transcript_20142/g.26617  ORF Transcript_20142/g.26617 Transcript_20142/m.26617 type:complete len:497 (-) Transcript_20142:786-2276(-)